MKITYALEDRLDTSFYPGLRGEVLLIFTKYQKQEFKDYKKEIIQPIEKLVKERFGFNLEFSIHTLKDAYYYNAYAAYDIDSIYREKSSLQPETLFDCTSDPSTGKFKGPIIDKTKARIGVGHGIFQNDETCDDAVDTFLHELGHQHWFYRFLCSRLKRSVTISGLVNSIAIAEGRDKEDLKIKRARIIKDFENKNNTRVNFDKYSLVSEDPNELISSFYFPHYGTDIFSHGTASYELLFTECEEYADNFMVKNGGGIGFIKDRGRGLNLDYQLSKSTNLSTTFRTTASFFVIGLLSAVSSPAIGLVFGILSVLSGLQAIGQGSRHGTYMEITERIDNIRRKIIKEGRDSGGLSEEQLKLLDEVELYLKDASSSRKGIRRFFYTMSKNGKIMAMELNMRDIGNNRLFVEAMRTKTVIG